MNGVQEVDVQPSDIAGFWIDEVGAAGWYKADEEIDAEIRARFGAAWEAARAGGLRHWMCGPERTLAYLILTDQFPRNMFREDGRAFATDHLARAAALRALNQGWDRRVPEPQRQFFYMPLMHSEILEIQEKGLRLVMTRMPEFGAKTMLHARAHREVIRRFGRFPHRNELLGRASAAAEVAYLDAGGYGAVVREMQGAEAA